MKKREADGDAGQGGGAEGGETTPGGLALEREKVLLDGGGTRSFRDVIRARHVKPRGPEIGTR